MKEGLVIRNVSEATKLPRREKKEMRVLSQDEQRQFIKVLEEERLGIAFLLDLGSGLRRGELLALRWKDIDLKEGVIRVKQALSRIKVDNEATKTALRFQELKTKKSQRSIPIPGPIVAELKIHKARQNKEKLQLGPAYDDLDLVFCTEMGKAIEPRNFNRKFYELIEIAGIPKANLHSLRHTYATRLLELNEHPKVVQELLGHSQISMTLDTYSHVMPEIKQAAANKLNDLFEKEKILPLSQ